MLAPAVANHRNKRLFLSESCNDAWRRSSSPRRCLTRPISPGLTHLDCGPLHALRRLLDALPEPVARLPVQDDEGATDVAPSAPLGHECERRLAGLALDAEEI